jgi:hypothetical protein
MADPRGLKPKARKKLLGAFAELTEKGIPFRLNSTYRSEEEQRKLYAKRGTNPYPVAPPGKSKHQKRKAADIGVPPDRRAEANAVLANKGWNWAGPDDEVHYDFGGGKGSLSERLDRIDAGTDAAVAGLEAATSPSALAMQYVSGGADPSPLAMRYVADDSPSDLAMQYVIEPEAAPDTRGVLQRGADYITDWTHNVFGASGRPINERAAYAFKPLMDLGNLATGGTLGTVLQKTVAPPLAAATRFFTEGQPYVQDLLARQMLSAEHLGLLLTAQDIEKRMEKGSVYPHELEFLRQNRFLLDAIRKPGENLESSTSIVPKVVESAARAFRGEQDPSLPRGGIAAAAFGTDNWLTQSLSAYYDAWLGGALVKGYGKGIGAAVKSKPGQIATAPVRALAGKANEALLSSRLGVGYQKALNVGREYREGQRIVTEELGSVRAGASRNNRINTQILDYSKKLRASGVNTVVNVLDDHEGGRYVRAGQRKGDLVDQLVEMYAEAGPGDDAFFKSKESVLAHAAKLGADPEVIMRLGEEASGLMFESGNQMVAAGLMDAKTFAANAGEYTRRFYRLGNLSAEEATAMLREMAEEGGLDTRTASILQGIAMKGDDSAAFSRKQGIDPHKVVRERKILNADERADYLPELSFIKSSGRSLIGQLRASAAARAMSKFADPERGLSAVARLLNEDPIRPQVLEQSRYKAELSRVKTQIKSLIARAERPNTGLADELKQIEGQLAKAQAQVRHHGESLTQLKVAEPIAPQVPAPRAAPKTAGGKAVADLINKSETTKYAKDLKDWQQKHQSWQKKLDATDEQFRVESARLQRAMVEHDQQRQLIDRHNAELSVASRRQALLEGAPATIEHADDALKAAMQKLDPEGNFPMDPAVETYWHQKWLDTWNEKNYDIFSDLPPTGLPTVPKGLPPEIADAMGRNNPLIAIALDETLSQAVPEGQVVTQLKPGHVVWGEEYGPMAGRAALKALKDFLDDAINPDRISRDSRIVGPAKWLGEQVRFLKLYVNVPTHAAIYIQSFFEGYATIADAGGVFNPKSYMSGMKEWGAWLKGGPETPTVKAILDSGIDMGGSFRTGIDPATAKPTLPGEGSAYTRLKDYTRRKFIDVQTFPKAGVTRTLIDQGMNPVEAAQWAEKGYGGLGVVQGGIETPGVMKLAEVLNSYGIAMFTTYPIHSMNRVMQLMVTNPQLALQFPLMRKYLLDQAGAEFAALEEQKDLRPTEVPVPTDTIIGKLVANPDGTPGVIDIANLVPHGGAFQPFSPPSVIESWLMYKKEAEKNAIRNQGLNPIDSQAGEQGGFVKNLLPGGISKVMVVLKSLEGEAPSPGATQPQTPLQASLGVIGLPTRDVVSTAERLLTDSRRMEKPERFRFMVELETRMMQGFSDGLPDMSDHPKVKRLDPVETDLAARAAQTALYRLLADSSISDDKAKTMIRNQMGYLNSLIAHADGLGVRLMALEAAAGESNAR